jgi:MFS family permease
MDNKESVQYPRFRWLVLTSAALSYITMGIGLMAFPPLLPAISANLGISMARANDFLSAPALIAAISLIFAGIVSDRFGIMVSLILSYLFAGVPLVLMPWIGTSYTPVLIVRIVSGLSAGFAFCVMAPIIAIWFPMREKGLASGLMGASVSVGSALGVVLAPLVFGAIKNWQQMIAWLTIPGWIGLAITIYATLREPPHPVEEHVPVAEESAGGAYKRALASPVTWVGVCVVFFAAWVMQCMYNYIPPFFSADKPMGTGFGPVVAGNLTLAVMLPGMVAPVVAGLLQDRVFGGNSKPVMLGGFVLTAIFTYLVVVPAVYLNLPLLILCLILTGAGIQFVYGLVPAYVSKAYPVSIVGKMVGLWMGLGMFGGAIGLVLGGLTVGRFGSFYASLLMTAIASVAGLIFVAFLKKLTDGKAVS